MMTMTVAVAVASITTMMINNASGGPYRSRELGSMGPPGFARDYESEKSNNPQLTIVCSNS